MFPFVPRSLARSFAYTLTLSLTRRPSEHSQRSLLNSVSLFFFFFSSSHFIATMTKKSKRKERVSERRRMRRGTKDNYICLHFRRMTTMTRVIVAPRYEMVNKKLITSSIYSSLPSTL